MHAPLSIFAAARDAGNTIGVKTAERAYTFSELAELTRPRVDALSAEVVSGMPHPLVGSNSLESLVALYALLELGIPVLLIHPLLTPPERSNLLARAKRAGHVPHPDAAAIIYTSGTAGEPRGAVLTRSALIASANAHAANVGWEDGECWLLCMPLARIGGLSILTRCLSARRCVAMAPEFDASLVPEWIAAHRVTLASMVPTMLTRVLDASPAWSAPSHLRAILVGGAAASPRLLNQAIDRRVPIVVTYGLTETCSQVTATPYAARFAPEEWGAGIPLTGIDVRIRDGRIEVKGSVLMAGYWCEGPLAEDAWFDTGDLGTIDPAGRLHVHARRADLIVTGGENAYPAEVERTLEAFPGIAAAGVFGVPDEEWGHTVAAVLVANGEPPPDSALVEYISQELAPHKRPRHVHYVSTLPHAATGKLDRAALAGMAGALRPLISRGDAPA